MRVRWSGAASADLVRIVRYLDVFNPTAARRLARALLLAADSLSEFPNRGRRGRDSSTRELAVVEPYILVYEAAPDTVITILRVWHAAQDRG